MPYTGKHFTGSQQVAGTRASCAVPDIFCWTKMGTEAGQPLASIVHRKELERRAGGGTFAWGIGNSLGVAADHARQMASGELDVLFTPMKSPAKSVDIEPTQILLWLYYQSRSGVPTLLPEHMLVTSRGGAGKRSHYALICRSDLPLGEQSDCGMFDGHAVRNLTSSNPVGPSQVTSVVRHAGGGGASARPYRVAFRAKLHAEGFVRLVAPVPMDEPLMAIYEDVCRAGSEKLWRAGVLRLRKAALMAQREPELPQFQLFSEHQ